MTVNNQYECDPNAEDISEPWSFELVDGKCITRIEEELSEDRWEEMVRARIAFLQPTWVARQKVKDEADRKAHEAKEAARTVVQTVCGEAFTITLDSARQPMRAVAGSKEGPFIIKLRISEYGGATSRWNSRKLKEPRWYASVFPKEHWKMGGEVTGETGNVASFRTWEAAAAAALRRYKIISEPRS